MQVTCDARADCDEIGLGGSRKETALPLPMGEVKEAPGGFK